MIGSVLCCASEHWILGTRQALAVASGEQQQQQQTVSVETARCERDSHMSKEQMERLQGVLDKLLRDNRNLQSQVEGCAVEIADFEVRATVSTLRTDSCIAWFMPILSRCRKDSGLCQIIA